jgi:lipopolysaccharide export system permease protein
MSCASRYIFRMLAIGLLAVTAGLAALVWVTQSVRFIQLVLERGLSLAVFLELTALMLPSFLVVILPITTFIVVLFVYGRLAADRELVVLQGAGLSHWRLARPALLAAAIVAGLVLLLQAWIMPASHSAFRAWQFEIRNEIAAVLLQEGVFAPIGNDITVYARIRERDGTLRGILVHDAREASAPATLLAAEGRLEVTPAGPRVTLRNGVRQQMDLSADPPRLSVLRFAENSFDLATRPGPQEQRFRDPRERTIGELLHPDPAEPLSPRERRRFLADAHQRLASPVFTLSLALVALAAVLPAPFRRHGGLQTAAVAVGVAVGLLAAGLAIGNLAVRDSAFLPLIWAHALLPGVISAWVLSGAPGLPRAAAR